VAAAHEENAQLQVGALHAPRLHTMHQASLLMLQACTRAPYAPRAFITSTPRPRPHHACTPCTRPRSRCCRPVWGGRGA
jgi:hypothetical protein